MGDDNDEAGFSEVSLLLDSKASKASASALFLSFFALDSLFLLEGISIVDGFLLGLDVVACLESGASGGVLFRLVGFSSLRDFLDFFFFKKKELNDLLCFTSGLFVAVASIVAAAGVVDFVRCVVVPSLFEDLVCGLVTAGNNCFSSIVLSCSCGCGTSNVLRIY